MVYFDQNLHTYACQYSLTTDMQTNIIDVRGFAEYQFRPLGVSELINIYLLNHIVYFVKKFAY